MSRICGPVFGACALLATVVTASVTASEPGNDTSSAAPAFPGSSAVQPVSLNVLAKPLKADETKTEAATTVKEKSESASKADESGKARPGNEAKSDKKPKPLKRRVIVVKATWCGACQALNNEWPKLRKVRWRIGTGDTDHFQLVDADQDPGVVGRYGVTQLPTLLLIEDGKVIDRAGVLNAKDFAEFYYGRL